MVLNLILGSYLPSAALIDIQALDSLCQTSILKFLNCSAQRVIRFHGEVLELLVCGWRQRGRLQPH